MKTIHNSSCLDKTFHFRATEPSETSKILVRKRFVELPQEGSDSEPYFLYGELALAAAASQKFVVSGGSAHYPLFPQLVIKTGNTGIVIQYFHYGRRGKT